MAQTRTIETQTTASLRYDAEKHSDALSALVLAAQHAVQSVLSGEHRLRKPGSSERFWQFRDYDPSDRPHDIDWRQSAKGDTVFVREKEQQNAQNVLFWCASGKSMDFVSNKKLPTKKQAAQILSLASAMLLTRGHETVQLIGGSFPAGRTEKTLQLFAEDLIAMPPSGLDHIHNQRIKPNSALVLVSDFLDDLEDIQDAFRPLSETVKKGLLVQVLDPAELELPYDGHYIFEGVHEKESINNVSSIRRAYQERMKLHIKDLKDIAHKRGWDVVLHTTDTDIGTTLFKIWMRLSHDDSGVQR
ncbi:MAG: DUF58 domain-containing protein [Pseudomonadota bacterium]